MADNSTLPATGEVVRTIDKASKKAQVFVPDLGGSGTENVTSPVGTAGTPSANVFTVQGPTSGGTALPVSAAALPLPAGAATAAKQPALGTAGTASADVLSVQGITGGTPVPVGGRIVRVATEVTIVGGTYASSGLVMAPSGVVAPISIPNFFLSTTGYGWLTKVTARINASGKLFTLRLHLFNATAVIPADGATYTDLYTDRAAHVGEVNLGAFNAAGGASDSSRAQNDTIRLSMVASGSSRDLGFVIVPDDIPGAVTAGSKIYFTFEGEVYA